FKKLSSSSIDIVLTDVRLPDSDGIEILQEVKKNYPRIQVIVMTNYAEINMAVKAMKHGAFDYVSKPFQPETILQTIQNALNQNEVKTEEENARVSNSKPSRERSVLSSEFVK